MIAFGCCLIIKAASEKLPAFMRTILKLKKNVEPGLHCSIGRKEGRPAHEAPHTHPQAPPRNQEESMIPVYIEPGVQVFPDGRERCDKTAAGKRALSKRRYQAWLDAKYICCLCDQTIFNNWTLEHKTSKGSGGSKHDDRQSNLGISHLRGNQAKGSMSLEQYLRLPLAVRIANCEGAVATGKGGAL